MHERVWNPQVATGTFHGVINAALISFFHFWNLLFSGQDVFFNYNNRSVKSSELDRQSAALFLQPESSETLFDHPVVEATGTGFSTWKALEDDSVASRCSSWRIQDFHLVWGAGTHDHGLGHHSSHLGWLQVAKQDGHAILHLHTEQKDAPLQL